MDLVNCYHILGIEPGAPFAEVKTAYRRLARRYHPDVNPDHVEWASQQFIEVTEAYQEIVKLGSSPAAAKIIQQAQQAAQKASQKAAAPSPSASSKRNGKATTAQQPNPQQPNPQPPSPQPTVNSPSYPARPRPVVRSNPNLSAIDNRLKQQSYEQLQQFLKHQRFPRAIALVEGLAQRIQNDPEVQQWQSITYQQWARYLADRREYRKAQIYLKKALKADPYNRRLWTEVKTEFRRIEQALHTHKKYE